jgi:hypothetical protein
MRLKGELLLAQSTGSHAEAEAGSIVHRDVAQMQTQTT